MKVEDGDELTVGKVKLKFLETPGHTPDGITVLAEDTEERNEPVKMLTGDTLFVGDVGRPDLVGSRGFTAEQMGALGLLLHPIKSLLGVFLRQIRIHPYQVSQKIYQPVVYFTE